MGRGAICRHKFIKHMQIHTTAEDHHIAKLTALAIGLHIIEAVIPSPLPGVKPGIANIVTLFVLYEYGFATAAWVSLLRVFASSLLLGQFLSPTFVLSLSGALFSLAALYVAQRLPKKILQCHQLKHIRCICAYCWAANYCAILANTAYRYYLLSAYICSCCFGVWDNKWLNYG